MQIDIRTGPDPQQFLIYPTTGEKSLDISITACKHGSIPASFGVWYHDGKHQCHYGCVPVIDISVPKSQRTNLNKLLLCWLGAVCPNYKPNLQLDIFKPCITHYPPKLDRADLSCGSEPLTIACRHRNLQEQQVDDPGKLKAKFFSIPGRCRVSHTPGACAGSCDCSAWQFGKLFQGHIRGPSWGKAHPSLW